MKIILLTIIAAFTFLLPSANASPIISGISTNEIDIDSEFRGEKILLFGAKGDAGNIVITVRGPKRNFLAAKKQKLLGVWYNGERVKFEDSYSFYSLFSTFSNQSGDFDSTDELLSELEIGKSNIKFKTTSSANSKKRDDLQIQLIDKMERDKLYSTGMNKVEFLDETLFKVMLHFPKNIVRGIYTVEIYLINEGELVSFQSIPIKVVQAGFSAKILDFANQESFLYGLLAVAIALVAGWIANYLFVRFVGK